MVLKRTIMPDYSTIKVKPSTKKGSIALADKHQMNMLDFYEAMVNYFEKTGVNPKDMVILSPAEELKKFRDTIISFLRKQEKDFIMPTFARIDTVAVLLSNYLLNKEENNQIISPIHKKEKLSVPFVQEPVVPVSSKDESLNNQPNNSDAYNELKTKYDLLELKYSTMFGYFKKVIENTENKSTGLNKAPVINLPMAEVNSFKDYLKRNR